MKKKNLNYLIKKDRENYKSKNFFLHLYRCFTKNLSLNIRDSIIVSRKYSFYKEAPKTFINLVKCFYYGRKNSYYINKCLLDLGGHFGKNLIIYHPNIVISPNAVLGDDVKLHGSNCIGNNGFIDKAPKIGNNVDIGFGAVLIGDIEIADDIIIGANAVVNKSFLEKGVTIAGVPARIIKHKEEK